jgi:hypothetical protein
MWDTFWFAPASLFRPVRANRLSPRAAEARRRRPEASLRPRHCFSALEFPLEVRNPPAPIFPIWLLVLRAIARQSQPAPPLGRSATFCALWFPYDGVCQLYLRSLTPLACPLALAAHPRARSSTGSDLGHSFVIMRSR